MYVCDCVCDCMVHNYAVCVSRVQLTDFASFKPETFTSVSSDCHSDSVCVYVCVVCVYVLCVCVYVCVHVCVHRCDVMQMCTIGFV